MTDYTIKDIDKIVQGIDGDIRRVDITRLTAPGENFLSLVFRVDFVTEKNGKSETVSAVAKCLPLGERKFDFNAIAMRNEIQWYSEVLPVIKEFANEFEIDCSYFPEYMGSRLSLDPKANEADMDSVLLLKNLIPEGYKNEDRYIGFDLCHSKALLRVLATFHATFLIMKFRKPECFQIIKQFLDKANGIPPPPEEDTLNGHKPPDHEVIDIMIGMPACQSYKTNLEALKEKDMGPMSWNKPGIEPWTTVEHRDYWVNNVMVKPGPQVKMIDFQMCGYSSYAKDVVFFLLSSVRDDVQKKDLDQLLRYYYEQLTMEINKFDITELKLNYDDYLEEIKRVALESETCHALLFSTVIFGQKGSGPDVLTGEVDMFDHLEYMIKNMSDRQKEKLIVMAELAFERGWL